MILFVEIPRLFKAFTSLLDDSLLKVSNVAIIIAIGKERTRKLGSLRKNTCNANFKESPDSTIFRTKSNITPTERDTTVRAETAKRKVGNSSLKSHLSRIGIDLHLEIIKLENLFNNG